MREIIAIHSHTTAEDGAGGLDATEVQLLKTYAYVRYLRSSRTAEANQAALQQVIEVKIWKRLDFTPAVGQIIKWQGKSFAVTSHIETMECPKADIINAVAQ